MNFRQIDSHFNDLIRIIEDPKNKAKHCEAVDKMIKDFINKWKYEYPVTAHRQGVELLSKHILMIGKLLEENEKALNSLTHNASV